MRATRQISRALSWIPPAFWHRFVEVPVLIPHWHVVSDSHLPHISGLYSYRTVDQFRRDLDFLLSSYTAVGLPDLIAALDGSIQLPARAMLLTFDDGFREVHDTIVPILHEKGAPAAFFLIASSVDNPSLCYPQKKSLLLHALRSHTGTGLAAEVLRTLAGAGIRGSEAEAAIRSVHYDTAWILDRLADLLGCDFAGYCRTHRPYLETAQVRRIIDMGFHVGAHSVNHPKFQHLPLDRQLREVRDSLSWVSRTFHTDYRAFSIPYTDAGLPDEFFREVFSQTETQITFGIGSLRRSKWSRHLPRFSMERTDRPAREVLARQFARTLLRRI